MSIIKVVNDFIKSHHKLYVVWDNDGGYARTLDRTGRRTGTLEECIRYKRNYEL